MITVVRTGDYRLIETNKETRLLILEGKRVFTWVHAKGIGEILVVAHNQYTIGAILSIGKFRLYDVKDEAKLTDLVHLELLVGKGKWQGYVLPTGLPDEKEKRKRIIPTDECITYTPAGCSESPHHDNFSSNALTL